LIFATPKYLASGLAKYQPLTLAVGSIAYELVRVNTPNFCLSDFIAPKDNDIQDYMGAFAVTTGIHIEPLISDTSH
jgi:cobalamin-dependent methionine synthase I